ncbi:MAG: hypothetical protein ISR57_02560 [Bacteroidales bacterium]|nr:hypothetical protein [Bacteroidales bacterium]
MNHSHIRISLLLVLFLISCQVARTQTYEEYLKQHQADFRKFQVEQNQLMDKLRQDYRDWVNKHDKEFSDYLNQEWENYQVFAGKKVPEKPKPVVIPEFKPEPKPKPIPPEKIRQLPVIAPDLTMQKQLSEICKLPVIQKPEPVTFPEDEFSIRFCGAKVYLDIDRDLKHISSAKKGKSAITSYWTQASKTNYNKLIDQLSEAKNQFNLNDYGYYMLLEDVAETVYPMPEQETLRVLLSWFLMIRSGYDVKMAYNSNEIAILLPSYNSIYGKKYITLKGMNYFVFSPFEGNNIQTYDRKYDPAHVSIDFNLPNPIDFGNRPVNKQVKFKFMEKEFAFDLQYDPGIIDFFADYPQVDVDVYFNAAISRDAKLSLIEALKPILVEMSEPEAINFLLHFVQTAFEYKTDPEQFDREKFFFAEEVIFYPASDCEDRSVLFAYLVRELLGMKVIGLEYPGHMSTAVRFSLDVPGDFVTYQGEKYIVTDPTFINAPFGRTMPIVGDQPAKLIAMNNFGNAWLNRDKVWEMAMTAGIDKANYFQSLVFDPDGNAYLTGYFYGKLALGSFTFEGSQEKQSFIVARVNADGTVQWADHVKSTGNAVGLAAEIGNAGNIYIAGSYAGKMGSMQAGKNSDIFLAKYTPSGKQTWIERAGLDTIPPNSGIIYSVGFSRSGKKDELRIVEYSPNFSDYGLFVTEDAIIYNGFVQNTMVPIETTLAVNATSEMDYAELLKKEYDRFVDEDVDRAAAGLFAIASLVRTTGIVIPGTAIQEAFDRYNPSFKEANWDFYKNIGKVSFMKNSNNIISITTANEKDITIDKMKVTNNARIRVSIISNEEALVDALNGVKVGKFFIWFTLNSVKVFSKTGDLLFDYDKDHTKTTMNIREDILDD